MGIFKFLLNSLSEDKLRDVEDKMSDRLDSIDYDSKKYTKIDSRRIDVVNEISSRSSGRLPKREHGWYLPEDD